VQEGYGSDPLYFFLSILTVLQQNADSCRIKQEAYASRRVKRERIETTTLADNNDNDNDNEITILESRSCKRSRSELEIIILD